MLGKHIRNIENYRRLQKGFKYNEKLRQAEQNFNYADSEHVDAAIMDLKEAEERLNIHVKEVKVSETKSSSKETRRIAVTLQRNGSR